MSESEDDAVLGDTGNPGEPFGAAQAEVDEATAFPNRADPEFWEAFGDRLQELCIEAELPGTPEDLIECMRLHWNELIDEDATKRRAKRRRLRKLREQRDAEDAGRGALEDEITELEREVGNNGPRQPTNPGGGGRTGSDAIRDPGAGAEDGN